MTTSSLAAAIPVRILSSVAVVGRDNEPIYLRGDLCDCQINAGVIAGGSPKTSRGEDSVVVVTEDEAEGSDAAVDKFDIDDVDACDSGVKSSPSSPIRVRGGSGVTPGGGGGLFGRIKGVVGGSGRKNNNNNNNVDVTTPGGRDEARRWETNDDGLIDDCDDDDPFGFFTNADNSSPHRKKRQSPSTSRHTDDDSSITAISLTQQLVLHASLDRFEEMACKSNRGGYVRWRAPDLNAPNSMWMGLLCRVEERWDIYGYLTNTGIKFMMLLENIHLTPVVDGPSRVVRRYDRTPPPPLRGDYYPSFPSSSWSGGVNREEADLKRIFGRLHDLYVQHTMNPFSQLRSPIKSRRFDDGVIEMARAFNDIVLEHAVLTSTPEGGEYGGGMWTTKKDGLAWM